LDELPEKCKEIFLLNRYENLKYKEIADKLNISIKTVEAQMSKALQHMKIRLVHYIGILILLINLKYL
jgi:RNA polymerase sigma-70 factor (ECF subfamily)